MTEFGKPLASACDTMVVEVMSEGGATLGAQPDRNADQRLLDVTLDYAGNHPDRNFDAFGAAIAGWGDTWEGRPPQHLKASDLLEQCVGLAVTGSAELDLLMAYVRERSSRHWEQSYTRRDTLVGEDMLNGYGFTEIVGKRGPFISDNIRSGIGVFDVGVDYPPHRHQAEEIYVVLAGSAMFRLGDAPPVKRGSGDVIHVTPQLVHGFTMTEEPLVVFYIWQGGDLREKSTFV